MFCCQRSRPQKRRFPLDPQKWRFQNVTPSNENIPNSSITSSNNWQYFVCDPRDAITAWQRRLMRQMSLRMVAISRWFHYKHGMILSQSSIVYTAVSSPQDHSKHFTLYFPDRPVHSDTISASLGSIQSYATINARRLLVHIHHCL